MSEREHAVEQRRAGVAFEAPFTGRCRGCGDAIDIGDSVVPVADYGYRHEECE